MENDEEKKPSITLQVAAAFFWQFFSPVIVHINIVYVLVVGSFCHCVAVIVLFIGVSIYAVKKQ